jgi:hypothetical protein
MSCRAGGADISSFGLTVSPGDVLAIVDASQLEAEGWWVGTLTDDIYAGGRFYTTEYMSGPGGTDIPGATYDPWPSTDMGFRTYVDPSDASVVPVPGALLLTGVGLVCGAIRRRR